MKGARSLATSWPVAEKLACEATMEQPSPSGVPFSAKSASFQVGGRRDLGQSTCLSKPLFLLLYKYTSGVQDYQPR